MSKFLDRLERIRSGPSAPIGFGRGPTEKVPGLALVGLVTGDHSVGVGRLGDLRPDAALLEGAGGPQAVKELCQCLPPVPWGAQVSSLNEKEAQSYQESGCDLLAFPLSDTAVAALSSEALARTLCLEPQVSEAELRGIDSLPVDVLLLGMKQLSGPWTLRDLATVGAVSRRVSKYILVQVSQLPSPPELEALRNAGVHGLVVDVGATPLEALTELKRALLEMPRRRSTRRERTMALLPSPTYSPEPPPQEEEEEEDE